MSLSVYCASFGAAQMPTYIQRSAVPLDGTFDAKCARSAIRRAITSPEFQAVVFFSAIGLLLTFAFIRAFPDFGM